MEFKLYSYYLLLRLCAEPIPINLTGLHKQRTSWQHLYAGLESTAMTSASSKPLCSYMMHFIAGRAMRPREAITGCQSKKGPQPHDERR